MKTKISIIALIFAILFSSCATMRSDSYYTKKGQKWNDYTNGKMKCKNNANPVKKFKS